ncbi:Transcriptional regulator, LacI family [Alteracholeplasma palmae J233]|uniref:Transcriptional regulator, LacI family n=2 Tax=Acholeplasma palmae TaxID=38986 RepID=U4KRJ1_ALTPJ|nr:Transcriptional regulator, LacI family [Alteracholeplasma palmae J233]
MKTTMKDIAKLAGVSQGTVDRVFNNRSGVNKETKELVLKIAKENNYQFNMYARALVNTNKNYKIGVVINSIGNDFFVNIIKGMKDSIKTYEQNGLSLNIIELKGYDVEEQIKAIEKIEYNKCDALVITPIDDPKIKEQLTELNIPIVTINNDLDVEKLAFVGCDYWNNGELAADTALFLKNIQSILIVTGSNKMSGHRLRVEGFISRINENFNEKSINIIEGQDDDIETYKKVRDLLSTKSIDLIYFAAGGIIGGLRAVKESNKEIKIITVDETPYVVSEIKKNNIIATISQQPYLQGKKAIELAVQHCLFKSIPEDKNIFLTSNIKLSSSNFNLEV